jgi:hypothetical protein
MFELQHLEEATRFQYQTMLAKWSTTEPPSEAMLGPLYDQTSLASWFSAASWLLTAMEATLLGWLLTAWFGFEALPAYATGVTLATALTVVTAAIAHAAVVARDEDRPLRASRLLSRLVSVLGLLFLTLMAGLVLARTASDVPLLAPSIAAALPFLLTGLSVVWPLLAGVLLAFARLYRWSRDLTRRWLALRELQAEVRAFYQQASRLAEAEQR